MFNHNTRSLIASLTSINVSSFPPQLLLDQIDADKIIRGLDIAFCIPRYTSRCIISITKYGCTQRNETSKTITHKISAEIKETFTYGTVFIATENENSFILLDIIFFAGIQCQKVCYEERLKLIDLFCLENPKIKKKNCLPIERMQLHCDSIPNTPFPPGPEGYWIISSNSDASKTKWGCLTKNRRAYMLVKKCEFIRWSGQEGFHRFELEQGDGEITIIDMTQADLQAIGCYSDRELVGKTVSLQFETTNMYLGWKIDTYDFEHKLSSKAWIQSIVKNHSNPVSTDTISLFHIEEQIETPITAYSPTFSPKCAPMSPASPNFAPNSPGYCPGYFPKSPESSLSNSLDALSGFVLS